jgi:hypothetical protein
VKEGIQVEETTKAKQSNGALRMEQASPHGVLQGGQDGAGVRNRAREIWIGGHDVEVLNM